jgi:ankyrin repeat protein
MLARPAPQNGETPLFIASFNGHAEVVRALLAKGADVLAKTNVSIARACALCPYRSLRVTYLQNAHDHL